MAKPKNVFLWTCPRGRLKGLYSGPALHDLYEQVVSWMSCTVGHEHPLFRERFILLKTRSVLPHRNREVPAKALSD